MRRPRLACAGAGAAGAAAAASSASATCCTGRRPPRAADRQAARRGGPTVGPHLEEEVRRPAGPAGPRRLDRRRPRRGLARAHLGARLAKAVAKRTGRAVRLRTVAVTRRVPVAESVAHLDECLAALAELGAQVVVGTCPDLGALRLGAGPGS